MLYQHRLVLLYTAVCSSRLSNLRLQKHNYNPFCFRKLGIRPKIPKIQSYTKHTDNDNGNGNDKENILPTASPPAVKDRATEGAYTEDFLDFWEKYPRKTGKGAAFRAWLKIRPTKKERADIVSALKWQKHSEQWTTEYGKFIPLPATYLNQRRWEDEPNGLCMGDITDPNRYKDDESDIEALRLLEEYVNGIN